MATLNTLAINCGSSSLRASLFLADDQRINFFYRQPPNQKHDNHHAKLFEYLLDDLAVALADYSSPTEKHTLLIGHRFVHSGNIAETARLIELMNACGLKALHTMPLC